jgi:outer membrane protein TolC
LLAAGAVARSDTLRGRVLWAQARAAIARKDDTIAALRQQLEAVGGQLAAVVRGHAVE